MGRVADRGGRDSGPSPFRWANSGGTIGTAPKERNFESFSHPGPSGTGNEPESPIPESDGKGAGGFELRAKAFGTRHPPIGRRETLNLSRTRVLRELETSQNPRYRNLMEKALADLNSELRRLERGTVRAATA